MYALYVLRSYHRVSLCSSNDVTGAAGKVKETSAQRRARKAEVAKVQAQAKYAWAILGVILAAVLIIIVVLSSSSKKSGSLSPNCYHATHSVMQCQTASAKRWTSAGTRLNCCSAGGLVALSSH